MSTIRILSLIFVGLITAQLNSFSQPLNKQQSSSVEQQSDYPFASTEFEVVDLDSPTSEESQFKERIKTLNSIMENIKKEKLWYKSFDLKIKLPNGFKSNYGQNFFDCLNYVYGHKLALSETPKALNNFVKRENYFADAKSHFKVQWADPEKKKLKYTYYRMEKVSFARTALTQEERHYLLVYDEDQRLKEILISHLPRSYSLLSINYNQHNKIDLLLLTRIDDKNHIEKTSYIIKKGT